MKTTGASHGQADMIHFKHGNYNVKNCGLHVTNLECSQFWSSGVDKNNIHLMAHSSIKKTLKPTLLC